jgi:two-component system, OmpR family, sensor kinase
VRKANSIVGRLTLSLTLVALLGALLLLVFIGIEYRMSFAELSDASALSVIIHELTEHVIIPMLLLAIPMTLTGLWAIRRAVRPLEEAARKIDAAQDESRGVRVDAESLPLETRPFARSVNALLDRVDATATMHEAFAADIAHELRTPLTLLSLELDQLDGAKSEQLRVDVGAMRRLIDQLMLLAQIDAERAAHMSPTPVDLVELAGDVVAQMVPAALADGRQIELIGEAGGIIPGRREAIAAALRNLVENALRVTPAGGTVVVLTDRPGELAVRDGGEGLSAERLEILVQRLRRADHASTNGAGLGLAIVARIMAAHAGRLVTDSEQRELRLIFSQV